LEPLFTSDGLIMAGHLARPTRAPGKAAPGVVICHGFPSVVEGGELSAKTFPELAERIANELGWVALVFCLRGCGESEGNFSLSGWLHDVLNAAAFLRTQENVSGVWVVGFGTGGAISICAAARDPEIRGVAAVGAPADFDDWASHPRRLLVHARELGIIRDRTFPTAIDQWSRELREIRAIACVDDLGSRPFLVMHGSDDEAVPVFDARVLADAHGLADLRVIDGGAHQLRHDPRAVAILLGWLDRQRNQAPVAATPVPSAKPGLN
jgi:alpha/beta superfamily hydrolase